MPREIRIPRLGWSMEEGTFVRWLKADGDHVNVGDPLYEFEGEKALQEVESLDAGILRVLPDGPKPGDTVAVGLLIGSLAAEQELQSESPTANCATDSPIVRRPPNDKYRMVPDKPAPRPPDLPLAGDLPDVSPRARRLARELKVDCSALRGTGKGGRIREADVLAAAASSASLALPAASERAPAAAQSVALSPRRKAIAQRLRAGQQCSLPVTITTTVDATRLVELRKQFRSERFETVPTYSDLIVVELSQVLKRHRIIAARWQEDHSGVVMPGDDGLHIGIAVDSHDGLLVPVLRDVGRSSLAEIATRSRTLIEQARSGRLAASEMQGGVFTVTNLGMYGVDGFTPIINYPEVAILGVGTIRLQPTVLDSGQIVGRHCLTLSLTFDHSVIDGAPAAAFQRDLGAALEQMDRGAMAFETIGS